jgi:hypothetical protein
MLACASGTDRRVRSGCGGRRSGGGLWKRLNRHACGRNDHYGDDHDGDDHDD